MEADSSIRKGAAAAQCAIRIFLADGQALLRCGVRHVAERAADMEVAGEATNGHDVLQGLREQPADVLVTDVTMAGVGGPELVRRVRGEWARLGILVLSTRREPELVAQALQAGANGYLSKDCEPDALLAGIRRTAQGGRFIEPALADSLVFSHGGSRATVRKLSAREQQVLQQLAEGHSIKRIADALAVSAKTVSTHKMRLMQKLGIGNNADLVRYAIRCGIIHGH